MRAAQSAIEHLLPAPAPHRSTTFDGLLDMLVHTLRAQLSVMSCVDDMREHSQRWAGYGGSISYAWYPLCHMPVPTTFGVCMRREFISPVLALALLVARAVTSDSSNAVLVPEYPLEGTVAWGPVDYVVLYRELAIIVVEVRGCLDGVLG
jgi:hypothetical protein